MEEVFESIRDSLVEIASAMKSIAEILQKTPAATTTETAKPAEATTTPAV